MMDNDERFRDFIYCQILLCVIERSKHTTRGSQKKENKNKDFDLQTKQVSALHAEREGLVL